MIKIILSERDFDYEIQALVNSFFPGKRSQVIVEGTPGEERQPGQQKGEQSGLGGNPISSGHEKDIVIGVCMEQTAIRVWMQCSGNSREKRTTVSGEQDFHKREGKTAHPYRTAYKNQLKKLLFDLLRETERGQLSAGMPFTIPAWGTMTGVRPTKIPMNELLKGKSREEIRKSLKEEYYCSDSKAELCMKIAETEVRLLQEADYQKGYSLYVGIPFCPTTCLYCSFPSYSSQQFADRIPEYLKALKREISYCGERMGGRKLTSVYVGGGTPTSLSAPQLEELLQSLQEVFPVDDAWEFTVEAGRPDSITREKLQVLRQAGVKRISINPQTMQDTTLELIGRRHTSAQTREVFALARECGFDNINMDLIIGLPGERVEDFQDTLHQIQELDPDGITIHSLVIKRASRLREVLEEQDILEADRAVGMERMLEQGEAFALRQGYQPYYMYRQKNSAGYAGSSGQENIGYARPGKECLYNILIMEEMQTILALGAGASTKYYDEKKNLVSRVENVKSVTDYIARVDEMLARKRFG